MLLAGKRLYAFALAVVALLCLLAPAALAANKPLVVTFDPVVADSGVTLKGSVLGDDGARVTESGFYYGVSRTNLESRAAANLPYELETVVKDLEPSTTYYVQAFAKSAGGEGLGEVVSFKTPDKIAGISEADTWADKLKADFGIQIYYKVKRTEWNHLLTYKLVEREADAVAGMKMIYEGLSKYPKGFISKLKLKYIALASEIKPKNGENTMGVAYGNVYQTSLLILATTKESVLHHELFHTFEYAFDLRFGDWDKANVQPKLYDEDLTKGYDMLLPGFITRYAMTTPREDRADLFMYLMSDSLREQLLDTAAHDSYLRDKIKRITSVLEKNLGKLAEGAKWSASAEAALRAAPKKLGTVYASSGAKLYDAPDSQAFSPAKEAPPGAQLDIVQSGSRWYKVLLDGQPYYIPASSVTTTRPDA